MGLIIPIAIMLIYGYLGYKLNRNYILWGLMGLGIFVAPILLTILPAILFNEIDLMHLWPIALITGPLLSVVVIAIIAYRNSAVFRKQN